MDIAVLGAGRVGGTLGARWRTVGHDVVYGVRDPADPRHDSLGRRASPAEAVRGVDVVLVALPWSATRDVLTGLDVGAAVVVDATNPIGPDGGLVADPTGSGGEHVAEWTGSGRVVKAFNTTGSGNMADPAYGDATPVMLHAGDDDAAKATVAGLAAAIGFEALDAGPLAAARDLEHLAMLWIRLAYPLGHGPDIAFALLRR